MINIVIYGLSIAVSTNNIHIANSCNVEIPLVMKEILEDLKKKLQKSSITMDNPMNHRSIKSMVNEWVAHNNLYKLGYKPSRTRDCDLNYPQAWYVPIAYWLLSRIVL